MVALLAEGVDRNLHEELELDLNNKVALLAEGVDRNIVILQAEASMLPSPSSRRAWIEIGRAPGQSSAPCSRPPRGGRG